MTRISALLRLAAIGLGVSGVLGGCSPAATPPAIPPAPPPIPARTVVEPPPPPPPAEQHELARLSRASGNERDYFGTAVALAGNRVLIGCGGDDTVGRDSGAAFLYELDAAGRPQLAATLLGKGGKRFTRYGYSVALGDNIAAVGADWEGPHSGAVYLYEPNEAGEWVQTARLVSEQEPANQLFGCKLAFADDLLLVGAQQQISAGRDAGAAFVFRRQGRGEWERVAKLVGEDTTADDQFGATIAISGRTAVIGSRHNDDNTGSAYVFQEVDGVWRQVAKLKSDQPRWFGQFGISVAVERTTVVVGEWKYSDRERDLGAAYVFQPDQDGEWRLQQKLTAADATERDRFGYSVAVSADRILVGMLRLMEGPRLPSAYLFTRGDNGVWQQTGKLRSTEVQSDGSFGSVVALDKDRALIGDESQAAFRGAAYLFELPQPIADDYRR